MKDKVIFWCGFDFTQFCMAYSFQKKYDCEMYSIIDITNSTKKFFETQKLVNFKKIWFLHDQYEYGKTKPDIEYLKNFEKKYNIDLWKLAINERMFYGFFNYYKFTSNEILSIMEQICRFYEKFFEEVKPDYFITKLTAFHHLELFRRMCIFHGVKVLMLSSPKTPKRNIISESDTKFDFIDNLDHIDCPNKSFSGLREELQSINEKTTTRELAMNYWNKHASSSKFNSLRVFLHYLISPEKNLRTHYNYYGRTKISVIKNTFELLLRKKSRESFMDRHFTKNPSMDTRYVYFPLGIVLERHILIDAPYYTNQVELIRHIVKSLPVGYRLLVKEHPAQESREWRTISEYKQILDIPNVTLIHPSFSDQELQKNCSLIISTAGGSAFEATFYEKPSIIFGNAIYSYLSSVNQVTSMERLPEAIKTSLNTKVDSHNLAKYMKVLSSNLIDFSFAEFFTEFVGRFAFSGGYNDVEINESELESFLKEKTDSLEYLAMCHIEKINQHKAQNLKKRRKSKPRMAMTKTTKKKIPKINN